MASTAPPPTAPQLDVGDARCSVTASNAAPFVVEWEGSERAQLEAATRKGVVAVRYQGCELEVVSGCSASTRYEYAALNPKKESVEIVDADDLYARFPRGAVRLEAELERAGSLSVDMMMVGRLEAESVRVEREQLQGPTCNQATHVVTGLTLGAFRLHTGAKEDIDVELELGREGSESAGSAGREHLSERRKLGSDGDVSSCEDASTRDTEPPLGCGALIRIEVVPLGDFERAQEVAEATRPLFARGTTWRKPALAGTVLLGSSVPGLAMMVTGMSLSQDADPDPFVDGDEDPRKRAQGIALISVGAPFYFGGTVLGVTFLAIAGVRKRRAKKAIGLVAAPGPGGLTLRF